MATTTESLFADRIDWRGLLPADDWSVGRMAMKALDAAGVSYAIGGGIAIATYSGRVRNPKDVDLYVMPPDRRRAIEALERAGFGDYYAHVEYDTKWIFRGYRDGVIVDIIWQMANYRSEVDEAWVSAGPEVDILGVQVRLLPVEELIWSKLYVLQRERCDWNDLLNLLNAQGPSLDWDRLVRRVGDDLPLVTSLVSLFAWLCPSRAQELPIWIWRRLGLRQPETSADERADRVALLDSRDWFGPNLRAA
jgi:hypothetical protein